MVLLISSLLTSWALVKLVADQLDFLDILGLDLHDKGLILLQSYLLGRDVD